MIFIVENPFTQEFDTRLHIHLDIDPIPQQRPRLGRNGVYNPQADLKQAVKHLITSQYAGPILEGPCCINYHFWFIPPDSWSVKKKRRALGLDEPKIYHHVKPDKDNLEKFINDCLDGTVIKNDAQIYSGYSHKDYSDTASIDIIIYTP